RYRRPAVVALLEADLERARRRQHAVDDAHVDLSVQPGPRDPEALPGHRERHLLARALEGVLRAEVGSQVGGHLEVKAAAGVAPRDGVDYRVQDRCNQPAEYRPEQRAEESAEDAEQDA